jgi:hypothetical protein
LFGRVGVTTGTFSPAGKEPVDATIIQVLGEPMRYPTIFSLDPTQEFPLPFSEREPPIFSRTKNTTRSKRDKKK